MCRSVLYADRLAKIDEEGGEGVQLPTPRLETSLHRSDAAANIGANKRDGQDEEKHTH